MDEIQRYWVEGKLHAICDDPGSTRVKHVVRYSNHLADKTAALEAQAEEHRESLLEHSVFQLREMNRLKSQHAQELAEARGKGEAALIQFEHPNLIGEPCMIHRDYRPRMHRLCNHASECCVSLFVTHSFRPLGQQLVGAIVKAAKRSNHHAGSAVDLNVMWDQTLYTSAKMREAFDNFPSEHPVRRFIEGVSADPILRWGGDWERKDEVHFDDNLVLRDPDEWAKRVRELRDA